MRHVSVWKVALGTAVSAAAMIAASAAVGETLFQNTIENRVMLAFKVDDAALQEVMPDGWKAITLPKGPVAGSNLIISFFDKLLITDAEGNRADPASAPVAAFVVYGVKDGVEGVRTFIPGIYEVPPMVDPFGVSQEAAITRTATMRYGPDGRMQSEAWTVAPVSGGELSFELDYTVAGYAWTEENRSQPYSPVNDGFYQLYVYDQLSALPMSSAMGRELMGEFTYAVDVPDLAGMFDGSEVLMSIVAVPIYLREVYRQ